MTGVLLLCLTFPAAEPPVFEYPDNYCGIYSVYAALKAAGADLSFESLCDRRYVGSLLGSSLEELQRAVTDSGGHALAVEGLTPGSLRQNSHPVVLHVRRTGLKAAYTHWMTYLGTDRTGAARVFDPPSGITTMSFADLGATWDGTGLIVSKEPTGRGPYAIASLVNSGLWLLVALAAVVVARFSCGRHRGVMAILVATALFSIGWQGLGADAFWRHPTALGLVESRYVDPRLPELEYEAVRRLVQVGQAVIVDCRFPDAYARGHIPGARSLPVVSGPAQRHHFLAPIPRDAKVIVYCQSAGCSWSKSVAASIFHAGYRDTAIYPGGWSEWQDNAQQ